MSVSFLRLGTRGSMLARAQSEMMAAELMRRHPGLKIELVIIKTTGDRVQDRPLSEVGGKGVFTKELEIALLNREIDFAVHSLKDVPVTMPLVDTSDLVMAAIPEREDARDVLIGAASLEAIPKGAKVGTSSPRRTAQVLDRRNDLQIEPLRGNIDTRLRKLREGQYAAILLAAAGLRRAGLFDEATMHSLDFSQMLPAPAQGALGLECRRDDAQTRAILSVLDDPITRRCVAVEREVVRQLNGDCHSPIASNARVESGTMHLAIAIGQRDGRPPVRRASHAFAIGSDSGSDVEHVQACLAKLPAE